MIYSYLLLEQLPSGAASPSGILAATESPDVAAFSGGAVISGTLVTTELADLAAFSGPGFGSCFILLVDGVSKLLLVNASDHLLQTNCVVSGLTASGPLAATETADSANFTGTVVNIVSGVLAATETADSLSFTGTVTGLPVGILNATETKDGASFSGGIVAPATAASPYPSPYDYGWYCGEPYIGVNHHG